MNFSFRSKTGKVIEAGIVLALVLLFFLIILATLNSMFPTGYSLLDLVRSGGEDPFRSEDRQASRDFRLSTGSGELGLGDRSDIAAVLTRAVSQVKAKRADQIAWRGTVEGMALHNRDAVQTYHNSSATLTFQEGNFLEMDENSLVVLRKLERDVFTRDNHMTVVLISGQLSGEVSMQGQENYNLEIVAPGAVVRAPSRAGGDKPARFRMTVQPDNSSVLKVLEGKAELLVNGEAVEVGTGQAVKVQPGKPLVYLRPPPRPPLLTSPADQEIFSYREIPPRVAFLWQDSSGAKNYHFVLAKDAGFREIVYEKTVSGNTLAHGNLKPGKYYWRVSSANQDSAGGFGLSRNLQLIQDSQPPALKVDYPDTGQEGDNFELSGMTDPDARIFVGGMPVQVDGRGQFTHDLFLRRGYNVIVVEAVDKVGNVNYFSKTVNVKF
jgi:mannose-6-phosphate isomerase-like protein (cupin superfamily)